MTPAAKRTLPRVADLDPLCVASPSRSRSQAKRLRPLHPHDRSDSGARARRIIALATCRTESHDQRALRPTFARRCGGIQRGGRDHHAEPPPFPAAACEPLGIRVVHPDAFLCAVHARAPTQVDAALDQQAADLSRPPLTVDDVLDESPVPPASTHVQPPPTRACPRFVMKGSPVRVRASALRRDSSAK
jgi:hypothetical protein